MRSFGLTKFNIYLPFLIISLLIGGTIFSLNSVYIPKANANFRNTIVKLTSTGMLTSIKSGQFFTDIPNATLFAEKVSEDGDNFEEVFLHVKEKDKEIEKEATGVKEKVSGEQRIIFANKGSLIKLEADKNQAPSLRLHLTDGNIVKINESGEQVEKILFKEYDFPVFSADMTSSMLDKDSMKTNPELIKTIDVREKDLVYAERVAPKNEVEKKARAEARKSLVKSKIEYFGRFIVIPQIALFVLLGFSLGIKKGRGGNSNNSIRAIIILLSYYGLYFFGISLAQRGVISAPIASFTPSVLLGLISLYYFRKLDWVG